MKLQLYNRENTKSKHRGKSTLNVSTYGGIFLFSKNAVKEFNLSKGDKIIIGKETGNDKKWFLSKASKDDLSAFELLQEKETLLFRCTFLARLILSSFKGGKSIRFFIPNESIEYNGDKFIPLIPILKNNKK